MSLSISFSTAKIPSKGTVAVVIAEATLGEVSSALDKATNGAIVRAMKLRSFKGKAGETLVLPAIGSYDHVVLVSAGKTDTLDCKAMRAAGGYVYAALEGTKAKDALVFVDACACCCTEGKDEKDAKGKKKNETGTCCSTSEGNRLALVAQGAVLRSYRFDKYHTKKKDEDTPALKALTLAGTDAAKAKAAYANLEAVTEGVFFTRDLVSEPANILYPESFAFQCEALKKIGLKVKVLGVADMKKLGMGALLGVGQGSVREPRLVTLEWWGNPSAKGKDKAPLALCGKGVTFDTGGISIKPSGGMDEMKWDMGGAGAVVGTMKALALRKAKANVVGVVGLVENMPDGNAQRPGDVVTSMSGQTIEVLNTDAEGRLVLADVLTYTQRTYKPQALVDLATLTGACIVTFGHNHAAILSNAEGLTAQLIEAGKRTGEDLWELPVGDEYDEMINSPIADMKNIGPERQAGTITAAAFIKRFVENDTPWAHLDIAGKAWEYKGTAICPKGGAGFGVMLLNRLIAEHYEK